MRQPSGPQTPGPQASSGLQASGHQTSKQASGHQASGVQASKQASGVQAPGGQTAGIQAAGVQATGLQAAGPHPTALHPTTLQPAAPGPHPPGRRLPGRVSVASPPRDTPDRVAVPPRRSGRAPLRFGLPLLAGDSLAALLSTAFLSEEQRDAVLLPLVLAVTMLNALAGLYRPGLVLSGLDQLPTLAARIAVSWCAVAAVLAAFLPGHALGLAALLTAAALQLAVGCACRSLVHGRRRATARKRPRSTLVVGTAPAARRVAALLAQHPEYGLRPVGIAAPAHEEGGDTGALPVLTSTEEIHRAVIQNGVCEAVFVDPGPGPELTIGSASGIVPTDGTGTDRPGRWDRPALVGLFHEYGCATWFVGAGPWDQALAHGGAPLDGATGPDHMARHVWGHAGRRLEPPAARRRGAFAKRLLDVVMTAPVLLAVSPVLLVCALAVRFCDGPGVLFRQERVGQDGRPFTLLKFRTLRADPHEAATRWSVAGDHRMSAVGNFLRRTSMDELPQLWNVLRGDMSLVGPRPERPYFVANFSKTHPGYAARHRMPVGITGLAQVHGLRGDTSIEDRSRFDNHYIDHWSLWQDVCILLRTAASLVRPAGS
ncbi:sugar transferase [Streptomyces liangshanensis]|uniref:sugar transferase n=1 Tax=Streptomyces liangshanensis TaxID=2717324 RepID=UPI001FB8D7AA|nr:sugar transferase [Streptomyces liangshanensis]